MCNRLHSIHIRPGTQANGIFCMYGDSVVLRVKQVDSQVGQAFTIAHEIHEILGRAVRRLHPRFQGVTREDPETEADVFASTLIMGESAFSKYLYDSGFDPIWLCDRYHASVRYTLMRVLRTLGARTDSTPFWATILRRKCGIGEGRLYTSGSCHHPRFSRRSRGQVPNLLFPKRGATRRFHQMGSGKRCGIGPTATFAMGKETIGRSPCAGTVTSVSFLSCDCDLLPPHFE